MRVALAQVDGKWPNLALAKLAAHHRAAGDEVELWQPLFGADLVYASKVFTDTPDDPYLPADTIRGGSGYDLCTSLDRAVETIRPDWSLWPSWTKDMGYSTRGCIRRCPFCNVRDKEGDLHVVASFAELSSGRRDLVLLDANIAAAPIDHLRELCEDATRAGVRLDYSQGLDARLLTDEQIALILAAPHTRNLHIAFDNIKNEAAVRRTIAGFQRAGFSTRDYLVVYILVGFDTVEEEDLYRIELVRDLGAVPFVMPFNRRDRYQARLTRWVNRQAVFRSTPWLEYRGR